MSSIINAAQPATKTREVTPLHMFDTLLYGASAPLGVVDLFDNAPKNAAYRSHTLPYRAGKYVAIKMIHVAHHVLFTLPAGVTNDECQQYFEEQSFLTFKRGAVEYNQIPLVDLLPYEWVITAGVPVRRDKLNWNYFQWADKDGMVIPANSDFTVRFTPAPGLTTAAAGQAYLPNASLAGDVGFFIKVRFIGFEDRPL